MIESKIFREAAALLIAAVCLGFAYNSTSPLGVRMRGASVSQPTSGFNTGATATVAMPQLPTGASDPDLHNETITAAIVSSGISSAPNAGLHKLPVTMSWSEVKPMLARGEIVLVDGRDSLSYEAGHIPGAVSLPFKMINEKIGEFTAKYPKTKPLIVYCASIQCPISHAEAGVLSEQFAYSDVREMPGGYAEWMLAEANGNTATGSK